MARVGCAHDREDAVLAYAVGSGAGAVACWLALSVSAVSGFVPV